MTVVDDYLRGCLATTLQPWLPPTSQWFNRSEDPVYWISVYRVYRVPYSNQEIHGRISEFGQVRAWWINVSLPYPELDFGFDALPDGTVRPKEGLAGWRAVNNGVLLLLMTPLRSDEEGIDPEVAARYRIDSARAVIVGVMGLNAAFEHVCEFSISGARDPSRASISRRSPAMENPGMYDVPTLEDESVFELMRAILEGIDSLDQYTQNRVRLALRWYQRALGERRIGKIGGGNVDALINYWIALETLARVGEQKVASSLIGALSAIHNLSQQKTGETFPISQIYQRRKAVIHGGDIMLSVTFELQQFLSDVFMDILTLRVMKLSTTPRTQKYLDGRAYNYL